VSARNSRSFTSDCDGGAALEFAILGPILIMFIIGILVSGWAFHSVSSVRYALAEAGRALQLDPDLTSDDLADIVRTRAGTIVDPDLSVTLVVGPPDGGIKMAEATVDYVVSFQFPLLPPLDFDFQTSVTVPLVSS
jgi:Flp pilus assembly protein TadG